MLVAWLSGLGGLLYAAEPLTPQLQTLATGGVGLAGGCAPLDAVMPLFRPIQIPIESTSPGHYGWKIVQDAAMARDMGIDLSGTVLFWSQDGKSTLSLPMQEIAPPRAVLLERLFPGQAISSAPTQTLQLPDGRPIQVTATPTALQFVSAEDENRLGSPDPSLVQGLPEGPGCLFYGAIPEGTGLPGAAAASPVKIPPLRGMALWLPTAAGPAEIRLQTERPLLPGLEVTHTAPVGASTLRPPLGILSFGAEPLPLIFREDAPWNDKIAIENKVDLEALRKRFWIPGGITLAVFNLDRNAPQVAMVMPITGRHEAPIRVGALRRALRKTPVTDDPDFDWTSRSTFQLRTDKQTLYGALDEGRILVATDEALVVEMKNGDGRPWLDEAAAQRAAAWPLYLEVHSPLNPGLRVAVGLRSQDTVTSLSIDTIGQPFGDVLAGAVAKAAPLAALRGASSIYEVRRDEVPDTLKAICTAQQALGAGGYLALPPLPRETSALNDRFAPWPDSPAGDWARLGWTPPHHLRGTYRAELSGTGDSARVSLYGSIDADGNGKSAEYVLHCPSGPEPLLLTDPDTY